jgi:hypothetical protein
MNKDQRAYYCINCSTKACPHKDDPAIIIARYLYPPTCDIKGPIDPKLDKRIRNICATCSEFVALKIKSCDRNR